SLGRLRYPPAASVSLTTMATQAEAIRRFADGDEGGWYARLRELAAQPSSPTATTTDCFPRSIRQYSRARFHTVSSASIGTAGAHSCFSTLNDLPTTSAAFSRLHDLSACTTRQR